MRWFAFALAGATASGAGGCIATSTLNTRAPKPSPVMALPPSSAVVADSEAELRWPLPIDEVLAALEAAVPSTFGLDDEFVRKFRGAVGPKRNPLSDSTWTRVGGEGSDVIARFRATRTPFRATVSEDDVVLEATVSLSVLPAVLVSSQRAKLASPCGCDGALWCGRRRGSPLEVKVRGKVALSISEDLNPVSAVDWNWEEVSECRRSLAPRAPELDLVPLVLEQLAGAFDDGFHTASERLAEVTGWPESLTEAWRVLGRPVAREGFGDASLALRLLAIGLPTLSLAVPSRLEAVLPLFFRPVWQKSAHGEDEERSGDLPKLVEVEQERLRGVRITMPIVVPLDELAVGPRDALVGRNFSAVAHHTARVVGVSYYGSDGKWVVRVELEGTLPGFLYLTGSARFTDDDLSFRLEEIDYTNSSRSAISILFDEYQQRDYSVERIYWFDADGLRSAVEEASVWSVASRVQEMTALLVSEFRTLEFGGMRAHLQLDYTQVTHMYIDREALRALALSTGVLTVHGGLDAAGDSRGEEPGSGAVPADAESDPRGGADR